MLCITQHKKSDIGGKYMENFLGKWKFSKLIIGTKISQVELKPENSHKNMAYELHKQLVLSESKFERVENSSEVLEIIENLISEMSPIIKKSDRHANEIFKETIKLKNRIIDPFVKEWRKVIISNNNKNDILVTEDKFKFFREKLKYYSVKFARIAGVEYYKETKIPIDFRKTWMEHIKISGSNERTSIEDSKFGGKPYWNMSLEYPRDSDGNLMRLLAQINFEQVPRFHNLPKKGILQFFIKASDDFHGMNSNNMNEQSNFRVVYHQEVGNSKRLEDVHIDYTDSSCFPVKKTSKMIFSLSGSPASVSDFRFGKEYKKEAFELLNDDEYKDYCELYPGTGHKIGGYGYFSQVDIRKNNYSEYDFLLLQLDTDEALDIMWGDCGVAHFFIKSKDLKKGKFDDILYTWDCY